MSSSDFDLETICEGFSLTLVEDQDLFAQTAAVVPRDLLRANLNEGAPLAMRVNTEKARSEFIIAPILAEVLRQCRHQVSLFSGIPFDVDKERGLTGTCDFLLARSPIQSFLSHPVVAIVEAKREDIMADLGPCAAAMVRAQVFNASKGEPQPDAVYGAVTTGSNWRFVKLEGTTLTVDLPEYYLEQVEKILGILVAMAA